MSKTVKIFAPASVANVSSGFDVLGFPINKIGDTITMSENGTGQVKIVAIDGFGNLSKNPAENVCGVIAQAMLKELKTDIGLNISLTKGVLPGSGLGSSAASSAGAAFAVNELLGRPFSNLKLVEFAMLGEALASGTAHADNVAPVLMGGFVIVRSYEPLDIISVPVPSELYCTVAHPQIELRTEVSRNILRKQIELKTATKQMGNIAGLIAGLFGNDYELIGRSMSDYIAEPARAVLIPGYWQVKNAALNAGALGGGISGSGPSVFSLSKGKETATAVGNAMSGALKTLNMEHEIHVSEISKTGCVVIDNL